VAWDFNKIQEANPLKKDHVTRGGKDGNYILNKGYEKTEGNSMKFDEERLVKFYNYIITSSEPTKFFKKKKSRTITSCD